jgi:NADH-quinone oxidoreductase subunit H
MPPAPTPSSFRDYLSIIPACAAFVFLAFARDLSPIASELSAGILIIAALAIPAWLVTRPTHPAALPRNLQLIALQLPLLIAILTTATTAGSLNLVEISLAQSAGPQHWLLFHNPFNAFAFLLAFVCMQLTLRRSDTGHIQVLRNAPFILLAALVTTLWLGAWYDPFTLVTHLENASHDNHQITNAPLAIAAGAAGLFAFLAKIFLLLALHQYIAKNLPRYRLDELLPLSLKALIPAAVCNLLLAAAYLWLMEPLPKLQHTIQIAIALLIAVLSLVLASAVLYAALSRKRMS